MLEINGKIHDRYTLEFKVGYSHDSPDTAVSDFQMDSWIFIPDSLYINAKTYSKSNFYRDFRALVRLITPVYTLEEVAKHDALPFSRLTKCCREMAEEPNEAHEKTYEHQVKMFANITRSALRAAIMRVNRKKDAGGLKERLDEVVRLLRGIMETYRKIPETSGLDGIGKEQRAYYDLGDEYLCRVINMHLYRVVGHVQRRFPEDSEQILATTMEYIDEEWEYQRRKGYALPDDCSDEKNRNFLHRAGQLKKYIESDLYILAHKKSNIFVLQQLFFMLAAGLSMVFATVISFSFQQTYGNFTRPLFIALVVSYMFKDRIKDLMHYWFSNKLGSKFYDYKIKLALHGQPVGWGKEGCDFVSEEKLPKEVREQRGRVSELEYGHCSLRETVIVYRRRISIFGKHLSKLSHFPLQGFNEIIRVNLREFLRRMDSPRVPVYINEGKGRYHTREAEKVYYVHFIMRYRYQGKTGYKRFRVRMNQRGIVGLMEW